MNRRSPWAASASQGERIEWQLLRGSERDLELEGDAYLGARLIRSYAREWLDGSGRFAALCLPYLQEDDAAAMQKGYV